MMNTHDNTTIPRDYGEDKMGIIQKSSGKCP